MQKQYVCFIILCTLPTNLCLQKYKDETKQLVSRTESTRSAPDRYRAGGYRRVDQRHCRCHCEIFRPAHVLGAITAHRGSIQRDNAVIGHGVCPLVRALVSRACLYL